MRLLATLFFTFAKIGAVTFGGGYAMLPMLRREICGKRRWATDEELMDFYAIGQCTPGIIAINTATFIGQKQAGVPGALAATLGMVLPSLLIIPPLALLLAGQAQSETYAHAMAGVRVGVVALIFDVVLRMAGKAANDAFTWSLFALAALGPVLSPLPAAFYIVAAGAVALLWRRK